MHGFPLLLFASGMLSLAACGDHAGPVAHPVEPSEHLLSDAKDLLVLSLPDGRAQTALDILELAKIRPTGVVGDLGLSGIYVAERDYDRARLVFDAVPEMRKYVCDRDCPANGGPSVAVK